VRAYDTVDGRFVSFTAAECRFAYRQSFFKQALGRYVITAVILRLPRTWTPVLGYAGLDHLPAESTAREIRAQVIQLRQSKLPDWRLIGNVGSFFHNPIVSAEVAGSIEGVPRYPQRDGSVKLSAAWLIERSGFKGYRLGGAGVSDKHALVIVNHGGATYEDVEQLSGLIRSGVQSRFGVLLTQEPETL
jgi:UDP-N-acetylmuramate dehydrogenase